MNALLLPRIVVARHLGVDPDSIDPDRPLASYGLDSLRSMELVAALEDATGRSLPDSFCLDHPTLNGLAGALCRETLPRSVQDAAWLADATLPRDFTVAIGSHRLPDGPQNVLLTGATGLLGAYLLRTIIDETDAQVWCLVRTAPGDGLARVTTNLARYGLWREGMARRIEIVRGDLAERNLGLTSNEYLSVASLTDAVMHAGADVDWVQPYAALRHVNVLGTLEVLRLAATARPKPVQFISSLSVCYVPDGPPLIDDTTDCLPFIARLPLGYAQTKCAAEDLCRQASERGLPVRVIRPGLIAGDSASGASNADDLIGRLVRGCIEMQAAPDLDWPIDALPADEVAHAIIRSPWPEAATLERVHLSHPRPRTWRECVLWINLLGYACRLVPFASWRSQLARDVRDTSHPLSPLRTFFAATGAGDSPAELYQSTRHSRATPGPTTTAAGRPAVRGMDAAMLARHVDGYVAQGALRPSRRARPVARPQPPISEDHGEIETRLRRHFGESVRLKSVEALPSDATLGIISDLTSWRRGRQTGVFRHRLAIERDGRPMTLEVVIKAKAHDEDTLDAARALAAVCGETLEHEVRRFEDIIGLAGAGDREVAIYEGADAELRRSMPVCYGTWPQTADRGSVLLLEDISARARTDAIRPGDWTSDDIDTALKGLASIHAAGLDKEWQPWSSPMRTPAGVRRMAPLWRALADHATPCFEAAGGRGLTRRLSHLVDTLDDWTPALDGPGLTLIHHDFNPRNAALGTLGDRRVLCAYDWELATIGLPQRDLAEFLCFVLPVEADDDRIVDLVERYRCLLTRASGRQWPDDEWREGFSAALSLMLIDRLAFYAMIHRVRPQAYLPRVLRTWQWLDAVVTSAAFARSGR